MTGEGGEEGDGGRARNRGDGRETGQGIVEMERQGKKRGRGNLATTV